MENYYRIFIIEWREMGGNFIKEIETANFSCKNLNSTSFAFLSLEGMLNAD